MIEIPLIIPDAWTGDYLLFIVGVITATGLIGLASRSLTVAGYGAFTMFAYLAIQVDDPFFTQILYVVLILIMVGMGLKIWRFEGADI